jgi:hypothetical protein
MERMLKTNTAHFSFIFLQQHSVSDSPDHKRRIHLIRNIDSLSWN